AGVPTFASIIRTPMTCAGAWSRACKRVPMATSNFTPTRRRTRLNQAHPTEGRERAAGRSMREDFRIDDVGRALAVEEREDVVDHDVRHLLAQLAHGTAEMRQRDHVRHLQECRGDLRLVLEHVEAG